MLRTFRYLAPPRHSFLPRPNLRPRSSMAAPRAPAVGGSTSKHSIKAARFSPPALMRLPMPDALQQPTSIGPFRDLFRRTIELKAVRVNEHDVGKVKKLASDRE